jgi:hypothetical protein
MYENSLPDILREIILHLQNFIMAKVNRVHNRQKKPLKVGFHRKKKTTQGKYVVNDEYTIKARKA